MVGILIYHIAKYIKGISLQSLTLIQMNEFRETSILLQIMKIAGMVP